MIERIVRDIPTETFEPLDKIVEKLNHYRELSKAGLCKLSDSDFEALKLDCKNFFNVHIAAWAEIRPDKLFRITNNKNLSGGKMVKLQKVSELIGPPESLSKYQRCNMPGESIFYAALDLKTAIWETQPEAGDYITISQWKIKDGMKLNAHSIFHPDLVNVNKDSQSACDQYNAACAHWRPDMRDAFKEILKFFTEEFMKPVKELRDYHFSASVASGLLQGPPDAGGLDMEAVTYPSVKMKFGFTNVAIKNSLALERLDLVSIKLWHVAETSYEKGDVTAHDMIKISAFEYVVDTFDFDKDKILYEGELEQLMEWLKHNKKNLSDLAK